MFWYLGWTSLPGGGSIRPHHGPIQNPIMDGINAGRANLDKLKQAGCKCHNKVHTLALRIKFEGVMS